MPRVWKQCRGEHQTPSIGISYLINQQSMDAWHQDPWWSIGWGKWNYVLTTTAHIIISDGEKTDTIQQNSVQLLNSKSQMWICWGGVRLWCTDKYRASSRRVTRHPYGHYSQVCITTSRQIQGYTQHITLSGSSRMRRKPFKLFCLVKICKRHCSFFKEL